MPSTYAPHGTGRLSLSLMGWWAHMGGIAGSLESSTHSVCNWNTENRNVAGWAEGGGTSTSRGSPRKALGAITQRLHASTVRSLRKQEPLAMTVGRQPQPGESQPYRTYEPLLLPYWKPPVPGTVLNKARSLPSQTLHCCTEERELTSERVTITK